MPNIPPLITHTPNAQSLYAAAGSGGGGGSLSYEVSTANPTTIFQTTTPLINLAAAPLSLNFVAGKAYLVAIEFTAKPNTPLVANTTDSMALALQSGGVVGRSGIYPLWNLGTQTASVGFTCVVPIVDPANVNLTFGNPNQATLVQTYTITIQSVQIVELATA
jgi:hypothetical protein